MAVAQMSPEFLTLPAEIRNRIYHFCLVVPWSIWPRPTSKYHDVIDGLKYPAVTLLRTCRMVYAEAIVVFYDQNVWLLELKYGQQVMPLDDIVELWHVPNI